MPFMPRTRLFRLVLLSYLSALAFPSERWPDDWLGEQFYVWLEDGLQICWSRLLLRQTFRLSGLRTNWEQIAVSSWATTWVGARLPRGPGGAHKSNKVSLIRIKIVIRAHQETNRLTASCSGKCASDNYVSWAEDIINVVIQSKRGKTRMKFHHLAASPESWDNYLSWPSCRDCGPENSHFWPTDKKVLHQAQFQQTVTASSLFSYVRDIILSSWERFFIKHSSHWLGKLVSSKWRRQIWMRFNLSC